MVRPAVYSARVATGGPYSGNRKPSRRTRCGARRRSRARSRERLADEVDLHLLQVPQPPWISRLDRDEVPTAMSSCSTSATRNPRLAASSNAPAPTMPPADDRAGPSARWRAVRGLRRAAPREDGSRAGFVRWRGSVIVRPPGGSGHAGSRMRPRRPFRRAPRSAGYEDHGRPPGGSRSARPGCDRPAPCRRGPAGPVFGRWKVTVRSARTTGSDGSPEVRSTAVGVSTASTGVPASRALRISSTAVGPAPAAARARPCRGARPR